MAQGDPNFNFRAQGDQDRLTQAQLLEAQRQRDNINRTEESRRLDLQRGDENRKFDSTQAETARQFDVGQSNTLRDFGFRESESTEDTRRFDIGQENRSALLEQLGLATPGGPAVGGGGLLGDLIGGGSSPSQGFTDLLSEQRSARDGLLSDVTNFGDSQRASLNRTFDTAQNNAVANLESRGLGASNLVGSATAQVAAERGQAGLELEDQLLGRRLDLTQGLNQGIFGTQEGQLDRDNQRQLQGISTIGQLSSSLV